MVGLAVAARLLNIKANRMASKVAKDAIERIRHDLFQKIIYLSGNQTDAFGIPSLVSRLTSDSYNVHSMIGRIQRIGVRAPIILVGGILITFTLEPVLTMVLIATLPLLSVVVYKVSKKGIPLYTKVSKSVDGVVRVMRENISGIRVIKALSKTEYEYSRFQKSNRLLAENIVFGREIDEERYQQAAKDACAYDYIMEKEGGFSHEAAIKGANLSGGQKQKLLISRALAAKPEILILDDSSSALDYKTDARLRQAIRENYSGTTIVMIAQRISSLMGMDHILVLEDGRAIGYGSHQELLESCEIYKEIYETQMGSAV